MVPTDGAADTTVAPRDGLGSHAFQSKGHTQRETMGEARGVPEGQSGTDVSIRRGSRHRLRLGAEYRRQAVWVIEAESVSDKASGDDIDPTRLGGAVWNGFVGSTRISRDGEDEREPRSERGAHGLENSQVARLRPS